MKKRIISFVINRPKQSLLASLLIFIVFTPFIFTLKTNFSHSAWYSKDHPVSKQIDSLEKDFGNDETAVLVIHSRENVVTKENLKSIKRITEQLENVRNVYSIESLLNFNSISSQGDDLNIEPLIDLDKLDSAEYLADKVEELKKDKTIKGYLLSKDFKTMLVIIRLVSAKDRKINYSELKNDIEEILNKETVVNNQSEFHILGRAAVQATLKEVGFGDAKVLMPSLFVIIIVFLMIFFRDKVSVITPLLVTLFSIGTTMGVAGLVGMEMVTISFIIPTILIAISIADSVHIVDIFHKKRLETDKLTAVVFSANKNFAPTLLTSLTTSIGFFSLLISDMIPIKMFGMIAGIGVLLAWCFSYFFLIPCLVLSDVKSRKRSSISSDFSRTYVDWLLKYKLLILISFGVITSFLVYNASFLRVDANPFDNFKDDHPLKISNNVMLNAFGGVSGPEIVIESKSEFGIKDPVFLNKVDLLILRILEDERINNISSPIQTLKTMNKALNSDDEEFYKIPQDNKAIAQLILLYNISVPPEKSLFNFITPDYTKIRLSLFWSIQSSIEGLSKAKEIEQLAKELDLDAKVTGKVNAKQKMVNFVITTFLQSIALSFFIVFIILTVYLRSLPLGILSMLPNITPLAFASGILVIMGQSVDFTVAVVSSICLGIAVDDTIHFLAGYLKAKKDNLSTEEAIFKVIKGSASSLILTTLILMLGFGVFIFSDFIPNRNFGLLSSGVLLIALVTDLVLLPVVFIYLSKIKRALNGP